jgi:mRNA deadenylase 3'-5' endonuclease subunit Ccr4
MDMNFGTWNMRSLNWSGTLKTVDRELGTFRSDVLGVQEFVLGKGVTE